MTDTPPKPFRERIAWHGDVGEIRDGTIRYMMIRPDALMGIFTRLSPPARMEALEAFAASIAENGAKSARAYQAMGADDARKLLDVIAATAPQLGWGIWSFTAVSETALTLEVANSPFVVGFGPSEHPVCAPIRGMLTAVGAMVLGGSVTVAEVTCAAVTGAEPCRFQVKRIGA